MEENLISCLEVCLEKESDDQLEVGESRAGTRKASIDSLLLVLFFSQERLDLFKIMLFVNFGHLDDSSNDPRKRIPTAGGSEIDEPSGERRERSSWEVSEDLSRETKSKIRQYRKRHD